MTLHGHARPVVLESHGAERGGGHRRLDAQQATRFRRVAYRGPATDLALDPGARLVPDIGSRIQGTDDLQRLPVGHPGSLLNDDHLGRLLGLLSASGPVPGERAPDADLIGEDGRGTTLFAHLYNPDGRTWGWSLLLFDGRQAGMGPLLAAAMAEAAAWDWVRPRLVLAGPPVPAGGATVLSDLDLRAHAACGLDGTPAVVPVRPDGHMAFHGPAGRPDLLRAHCETVFGPAEAVTADLKARAACRMTGTSPAIPNPAATAARPPRCWASRARGAAPTCRTDARAPITPRSPP